jgi:hypothetical protein
MNTCNWTRGGIGLAVAVLAAMTTTGCDPYLAANTSTPVVLGVTMVDTRYQSWFRGVLPGDSEGCVKPYADPDLAWADANFPGLCGGYTSVCPVLCYPNRTGPAYAPFFTGNLGGTYKKFDGTSYTYAVSTAYTLSNVPSIYVDGAGVPFRYSQILVLFNKTMDPQSIQPDPNVSAPPATLQIFEGETDVTNTVPRRFNFEYNPNSDTTYWGASVTVTAVAGRFAANTTYHIVGTVKDQQGNSLPVDVTVNIGSDIPAP